jgi:hypothetical protein
MFVANMETQHYSFTAIGETEDDARRAVALGFSAHLTLIQDVADPRSEFVEGTLGQDLNVRDDAVWTTAVDDWYAIRVVELQPGQCARDDTVILHNRRET